MVKSHALGVVYLGYRNRNRPEQWINSTMFPAFRQIDQIRKVPKSLPASLSRPKLLSTFDSLNRRNRPRVVCVCTCDPLQSSGTARRAEYQGAEIASSK